MNAPCPNGPARMTKRSPSRELVARVRCTIAVHDLLARGETVVLGLSGGPDSLCLLHVLRDLSGECGVQIHAAHLNHAIRGPEADDDARWVSELCARWQVPITVQRTDVPALAKRSRLAIEEAARQARYVFLGDVAREVGSHTVAVAHNADDQVETVLMHLMRGTGIAGLRGMRPASWLDELRLGAARKCPEPTPAARERQRLIRPLLEVPRAMVEAYCREQGLEPRFDCSNLDTTYYRNRLRHELLPLLSTYNPSIRSVLANMADVVAADYEVLRGAIQAAWQKTVLCESSSQIVFDLTGMRALPVGLQRSLLREGVHRLRRSLRDVSYVHIVDAIKVLQTGHVGAQATLPQGTCLVLGYSDAVLASRADLTLDRNQSTVSAAPSSRTAQVAVPGRTWLGDGDRVLTTELCARRALPDGWARNSDPFIAYLDAGLCARGLSLRTRREGDWFRPHGMGGHRQLLRDYLINAKVPRNERALLPLLVCGDDIAWVVGLRVDERYGVSPQTETVLIVRAQREKP